MQLPQPIGTAEDKGRLILVADDNDDTRELFSLVLANFGYSVIEAADGQQALALASNASPDAVVLDLSLPKLSGRDVIAQLRADPATARIPILVFTGQGVDDAERAVNAGANGYCTKPCLPAEFIARLDAVLSSDLA